jgi:hypothetical protein
MVRLGGTTDPLRSSGGAAPPSASSAAVKKRDRARPRRISGEGDDTWYVLEGQMAVRCGDDEMVVGGGHWVSMPRGVPHTFRVIGDQPTRILTVHDNATFRDFVRELGSPAADRVVPTHPSFPTMDELVRVAAQHDLKPVGPPMSADQAATILTAAAN